MYITYLKKLSCILRRTGCYVYFGGRSVGGQIITDNKRALARRLGYLPRHGGKECAYFLAISFRVKTGAPETGLTRRARDSQYAW